MNRIRRSLVAGLLAAAIAAPAWSASGDTVLVAGATGRTGKHVVEQLVAAGYRVKALVRDPAKAQGVFPAGVELVMGDVREPATLEGAIKGVPYVVSTIGAGGAKPEPGNGPREVDFQGNVNLVDAAKNARVKQFVLVSSAATSKAASHPMEFMRPVLAAKFESEEHLRASGVPYTIVKPGGLIDEPGGQVAVRFAQGDSALGRIPRADVATVAVAALGRKSALGRTFEVYSGTGAPVTDWEPHFAALGAGP
jgi:uncharacterized protein YbjT (DUF2867 family)